MTPFNESGSAVKLAVFSAVEVAFLLEMIVDRGMDRDEFLQVSHAAGAQHRQGWLVVGSRLEVAVFGNASAVCDMANAECKQQQSVVGLICTISRVCNRFSGRPLSNFYSASKIGFDANIFYNASHSMLRQTTEHWPRSKTSPYKCSKPNVE